MICGHLRVEWYHMFDERIGVALWRQSRSSNIWYHSTRSAWMPQMTADHCHIEQT